MVLLSFHASEKGAGTVSGRVNSGYQPGIL
jgi:hypothetical protein